MMVVGLFGAGIGLNTAMFSVVNGVLLRPLKYDHPDRIVVLETRNTRTGTLSNRVTGADFVDLQDSGGLVDAIGYYMGGEFAVRSQNQSEFARSYWVSAGFFPVFSVDLARGRTFREEDASRAAIVSTGYATRNFGGVDQAVGQTVNIENHAYEITGVTRPGFQFQKGDVWLALPARPEGLERTAFNYRAVARLKPGVTIETAQAAVTGIAQRLAAAYPASNRERGFAVVPLRELMVSQIRTTLNILMGAVAMVLLIVCANVANLSLVRAAARSRENAVRAALGASWGRILGEQMIESCLLAIAGGALGVLIARVCIDAVVRFAPASLPRVAEISLDRSVLVFALCTSVLASVISGLIPAWQATRLDLNDTLKQGSSRGVLGGGPTRTRHVLVVVEIALSFILVTGAVLLFRSFIALNTAELGYRAENMLVMYAQAPARGLAQSLQASRSFEDLFARLKTVPGIVSVAGAVGVPSGTAGSNGHYAVEGKHTFAAGQNLPGAGFLLAGSGYFETMGIPLVKGREFSGRDAYEAPFVAIVNAGLVRQIFPTEDPLGQRIRCGLDSDKWMTIVGVVGDVRQESPASPPAPELYMPLLQHPNRAREVQVVMRTAIEPASLTAAVREATRAIAPTVSTKFTTMQVMVSDSIAAPRFRTFLIATFASLAMLLGMAGTYGLMTYIATERISEFGLRIALGANPSNIMGLMLRRALILAAVGLGLGLIAFLALGRVLESLLFGLKSTDAFTCGSVLFFITLATLAAAIVPAWRSMRVDPIGALRV
jgi:predicted permease